MNLRLPPDRPLPNADRMVEEVLRSGREQPTSPVRRSPWLAVAAAAVVAGVAVGVLVTVRGPILTGPVAVPSTTSASPGPALTPSPVLTPPTATPTTPTPTPTPVPTPPRSSPPASSTPPANRPLALGETVTFTNFEVTVTRVETYVDRTAARAKVCVRSLPPDPTGQTTRVSIDPWAIAVGERSLSARAPRDPSPSGYPTETFLRVGQCVEGWIEFPAVPEGARLRTVQYANSLGDRAAWTATR